MKKNVAVLIPLLLTSLLCSCSLSATVAAKKVTMTKSVSSYVLFNDKGDTVDYLNERKLNVLDTVFVEGEELLPYLSLEQYSSLAVPFLNEGFYSKVEEKADSGLWTVRFDEGKGDENPLYFAVAIIYSSGSIGFGGSLSSAMSLPKTVNSDALSYRYEIDADILNKDDTSNLTTCSFSTSDFSVFSLSGTHYLPLGLWDITLADATGLNVSYDYENFLVYDTYSRLEDKLYGSSTHGEGDEKLVSALDLTKRRVNGRNLPKYLAAYNRNCFLYLMDNFYGLNEELGISHMRSYYINTPYIGDFISDNPSVRQKAYSRALDCLNDGHSGFSKVSTIWGESKEDNLPLTGLWSDRVALRNSLVASRNKMRQEASKDGYDIFYSASSETAFFSFDSFSFAPSLEELVNEEETAFLEDAYKVDGSALIVRQFEQIKKHGGVKNVVIDLSVNGGGTVGSLLRILALLSKDNKGEACYRSAGRNAVYSLHTKIDSNFDNLYDQNDVYGDDFNIYFLTSSFTYSSGNALPYFANLQGSGKCIGATSGGGMCFVGGFVLPNFQSISISSKNQFGSYDESSKTFTGNEKGTPLAKRINYGDFYDIEALESAISEIND